MSRINASTDTTYAMQSLVMPKVEYSESVFTSSQLHPGKILTKNIRQNQPGWIPVLLIICLILITWSRVFYPKRMQQVFRAPFSKRFINLLTRDGNLFRERISVALGIVYVIALSLLFYEFNRQILGLTFQRLPGITLYLAILVAVMAFQTVKVALIRLLGMVFKTKETTYNYQLNMLIMAIFSGPPLLIALILCLYLNSVFLLYCSMAVSLLLFSFRFMKGFFIGITLTKFSYLFLFVYLCSLEILPLLIIIKLLLIHANSVGG